MNSRNGLAPPVKQAGVALAISLVLLVAMTLLGVATLSGTRLNEKVTSNAQQKAITFEAAESAIYSVWSANALKNSMTLLPVGEFNDPSPVFPPGLDVELSADFDQSNERGTSVDIIAGVSIQYCGERAVPAGVSLNADISADQFAGKLFDVIGNAQIDNTNARSVHIQRAVFPSLKNGQTGDACVVLN